jgi:hypothetical protein
MISSITYQSELEAKSGLQQTQVNHCAARTNACSNNYRASIVTTMAYIIESDPLRLPLSRTWSTLLIVHTMSQLLLTDWLCPGQCDLHASQQPCVSVLLHASQQPCVSVFLHANQHHVS